MRNWIERHQVLVVALAAAACLAVWVLRDVFVVLFLGYILAAALRPAVDWLHMRVHVPRVLAILGLYVVFFAILLGIVVPGSLPIAAQGHQLAAKLSQLTQSLDTHVPFVGPAQIQSVVAFVQAQAAGAAAASLLVVLGLITSIIVSVYLLYDWHALHATLGRGSAGRAQRAFARFVARSEASLGAWVRGQLLLSTAVAAGVFIALLILNVQFAPVLAVLAWIFELIPYAGPFLAAAPAVIIGLSDSTGTAIGVIIAYTVIQQLESNVLVPMVMRRSVDLHPVVVIGAMLAGFDLLGIEGGLLAVPAAVMVRIGVEELWAA